jgi:hypothetical protein
MDNRLGLWDFRTVDAEEIRYGGMDWIKLAVNRVERVLGRRWKNCHCANYLA